MSFGSSRRFPMRASITLIALCVPLLAALPVAERTPRETPGSRRMLPETMHLLMEMERDAAPDCSDRALIRTEAVRTLEPSLAAAGKPLQPWRERWTLDRCGVQVAYEVRYTPSERRTTDVAVRIADPGVVDGATSADATPAWADELKTDDEPRRQPARSVFLVTNAGDSGPGSLTQAILDANATRNQEEPDAILFSIPASGPHVIALVAALPAITDPVVIDGYSQPGSAPGSLSGEGDAAGLVEIDGSQVGAGTHGLLLRAGSSTIRGLWIHGFTGDAIRIVGGGSNRVEGNVLGAGNGGSGVAIVDSFQNRIGGAGLAARNVIQGNGAAGVSISGRRSIGNAILDNRVARNSGDGIDLVTDGPKPVHSEVGAPNNGQQPPLLASMTFTKALGGARADMAIEGSLAGAPGALYRVELFATTARPHLVEPASAAQAASANESADTAQDKAGVALRQGERFLASIEVTTGADGQAGFQLHLPSGVHSRDLLTATATDVAGNTSEFSQPIEAAAIALSWNAGTGNWGTAANWSPAQVPALGDDVTIAANGPNTTFTVTCDVASSINSLTLGGGSGIQTLALPAQTLTLGGASTVNSNGTVNQTGGTIAGTGNLTINGTLNWSGGLMTGAATTTVNGTINITGLPGINGGRTLDNTATVNWASPSGSGIWTGTGSIINNHGTWDAKSDGELLVNHYGGATTFNNFGLFKKSTGPGTITMSIPFFNTGTVDVQSGTLSMSNTGSSTGALNVSGASATLLFASGVFDLNAGTTITGPGMILMNSSGTVNVNSPLTIPASTTFTFLNGTVAGAGGLTINGPFTWTGGLMTGAATTTVNGTLNITGLPGISGGRILDNTATVNWVSPSGSGIWTGTGSVINNHGTWDARSDGELLVNHYGGATTFNNFGLFKKSTGPGTISMSIPFVNSGTVDVQSGTLSMSNTGSSTSALVVSGASSTLLFASGVFDINAGTTITGPGTVLMNGSATVNVNSPLTIPASTTLTFLTGTVAGIGNLTINGPFTWTGGLMTGAATTTVNGTLTIDGLPGINGSRILDNTATVNWASPSGSGIWTGTGSVINNHGTWDAQSDGELLVNHYGGATTFNNFGLFKKSTGAGTISIGIPFVHTGTLDVQSGTLSMGTAWSSTSALIVSGASSTLQLASGVFDINAGTTITGPGTVLLNSTGTVNVNSPLTIPASTTFTYLAGTVAGTGGLTINGPFNWSGGLMTGAATTTVNGTLSITGLPGINNGRILDNTATVNWASPTGSGIWTGTGSIINNHGTWDAPTDGELIVNKYGGATTFNNFGTFKKSTGTGINSVQIPFFNTGTVDVQSGTLNMSSSNYTQTAGITRVTGGAFTSTTNINIQGGVLAGTGTITGPVIVSGTGALAPGLSPGTLNLVGNYTQQAPNGAFNVEIGGTTPGTQYDQANVSGAGSVATLAGNLNVTLVSGFVPAPGDSFTVMTYLSHTGSFVLNAPALPCLGWRATYGATALVLQAVALPTESTGLQFQSNAVNLTWDPALTGPPATYDVLRGVLSHQPVGSGGGETCLAQGLTTPSTVDATVPATGVGFWYLVRERRAACGVGTYGLATSGAERLSLTCP